MHVYMQSKDLPVLVACGTSLGKNLVELSLQHCFLGHGELVQAMHKLPAVTGSAAIGA